MLKIDTSKREEVSVFQDLGQNTSNFIKFPNDNDIYSPIMDERLHLGIQQRKSIIEDFKDNDSNSFVNLSKNDMHTRE